VRIPNVLKKVEVRLTCRTSSSRSCKSPFRWPKSPRALCILPHWLDSNLRRGERRDVSKNAHARVRIRISGFLRSSWRTTNSNKKTNNKSCVGVYTQWFSPAEYQPRKESIMTTMTTTRIILTFDLESRGDSVRKRSSSSRSDTCTGLPTSGPYQRDPCSKPATRASDWLP